MKRYDEIVLNKLIDSYENSAAYREKHYSNADAVDLSSEETSAAHAIHEAHGANAANPADGVKTARSVQRRGIFCRIDRKSFPEYFDASSGAYNVLHEQLADLEQKGLIKLYWRDNSPGHILEKVSLVSERADDACKYIDRKSRAEKEARIIEICRKYVGVQAKRGNTAGSKSAEIAADFAKWAAGRIRRGESVKQFVDIDDPDGFERLCRMVEAITTNENDVYLRQFSVTLFNDSKIAEKMLDRAASVIIKFGESNEHSLENKTDDEKARADEIPEKYGVYRNPVWIYMKGHADIRIAGGSVELSSLSNGAGVSLRDLDMLEPGCALKPDCILTVENLTSYYQQDVIVEGMNAMVIYLGGYAGSWRRDFLRRLHAAYPEAKFMHSGDIDCGGFRIWKSMCEGTGIAIEPYRMDLSTFEKYRKHGKALSAHDIRRLGEMREDQFFADRKELFERMLETGLKLEQESFDG